MKLHLVGYRIVATAILSMVCFGAYSQVVEEQAWRVLDPVPPGTAYMSAGIGADIFGNTYTLENNTASSGYAWLVRATDPYGNLNFNRTNGGDGKPAFGMVVDYYSGNYFVLGHSIYGGYPLYGYLSNGYEFNVGFEAITPLSMGIDYDDGQVSIAYEYGGYFYVSNISEDGFSSNDGVTDTTLNATYAAGDQHGNTFASGTTTGGKVVGKFFSHAGKTNWTRSFTNTSTTTYSVGPFAEDPDGNQYLIINIDTSGSKSFTLLGINGSSNFFSQTGTGTVNYLTVADSTHIYVAGQGTSSPFLTLYSESGVQWSINQAVQVMSCPNDNSDSVLIAAYEPAYKDVVAHKYSSAGASEYAFYWEANSAADVASNIQWVLDDNTYSSVYIAGTTIPSTGASIVTIKYLEGPALKSATWPSSLVGGKELSGTVALTTGDKSGPYEVAIDGGANAQSYTYDFAVNAVSAVATDQTYGVDNSTPITITTSDSRGVQLTQAVTLLPAQLNSLSFPAGSVTPDASVTGTITLNGQAGPSGTPVSLSSDTTSAVVPSSVTVPGYETGITFNVATKAVAATTVAHITAKQGGVTETEAITLVPPVLSLLSPATVTVIGGNKANLQVWLNGEPAAAVVVSLKSSNPTILPVSPTVTIAANTSNTTFTLTSTAVTTNTTVTVTATYGSVSKSSVFTVEP